MVGRMAKVCSIDLIIIKLKGWSLQTDLRLLTSGQGMEGLLEQMFHQVRLNKAFSQVISITGKRLATSFLQGLSLAQNS